MRNKIRNSLIAGTVLSLLFAQGSLAAPIDSVKEDMSTQAITVSGSGLVKNDKVFIEIYDCEKGGEERGLDYENDLEGALAASVNEDGGYTAEFKLPGGVATGRKLIRVKPIVGKNAEQEFEFYSSSSINTILTNWNEAINNKSSESMEQVINDAVALKIILNTSLAQTLQQELLDADKTKLTEQLLTLAPAENEISEFADAFKVYYLEFAINNLSDKTLAKLALEFYDEIDTAKSSVYENIISKMSDEEKTALFEEAAKARAAGMSTSEFAELIYQKAVYKVFTGISYYKDVKGFIDLYNDDYFKVDFSVYDTLENTYNVDSKVLSQRDTYSDFDSFRKKYAEWIKAEKTKEDGSGSSSSGSSGRGSSGGGGASAGVNAAPMPVAEENFVEDEVFEDLAGFEWAEEHIMALYNKGAVDGVGLKKFEPSGITAREQFVKMISALFTVEKEPESAGFTDVPEDEWYARYINNAKAIGLISGKEDNTFGVGESITREDAAVICFNALKIQNPDLIEGTEIEKLNFRDADEISAYAIYAVSVLNKLDIIKGDTDGCIKPAATTTRAEAATMISRVLSLIQ